MHKEGARIVESPVEARGGFLGKPVLVVLIVSVVAAVIVLAVTFGVMK